MDEHVLIQHALKLLAEYEYEGENVDPGILSEKLSMPEEQITQLVGDLISAGLIETDDLSLTSEGREFAMHVLQAHRLYETYLARKTGLPESAWHTIADAKEHKLSKDDVQKLAEELGNPLFDPHGDPIPSITGQMPPKQGKPLTEYPSGWAGRVVHIEDEPPHLYAYISNAGIAPDTMLRIDKINQHEIEVFTEGLSFTFPIEAAKQITAVELAEGESFDCSIERLSSLKPDEQASIISLSPLCRGLERNRLLDLGVVPGSNISIDLINPSGNPIGYHIRGACIALRLSQAERIRIRKAVK